MINVLNKNNNPQEINQAKINFRKDMKTLRMNLAGIDKNLKGYGYKYQNFNEIVREIKNVINKHNLDLDFGQFPTFTIIEGQKVLHVVRTTFFSTISDYEYSFDTPIYTENLQWNNENGPKNVNTLPQLVGSSITYFKRYALVAYLNIESEVDTDAAPIYNNYENVNSTMPSKQESVNQEQKKDINQNQKKDNSQGQRKVKRFEFNRFKCYKVFIKALCNIKNWVNDSTTKDNINLLIKALKSENDIDLARYMAQNSEQRSISYWTRLIKDYLTKNEKLEELHKFEVFTTFKEDIYGESILKFFCVLKEEKQFDYIFAA
ncbi:ERF family protein [Borreliella americana]|uniref:ERF family protein n=1 Tax=Borreliella americana TaxID=478807 RepID=UPI001E45ED32|nr:ERF family protein [Borreliella americana]MCD2349640.1 ERF family protein [Borreliella americana]